MRVYTRGVDEALVIGHSVQVSVLEVQTDCVRLAIIDPDASPTYREEVLYLPTAAGDDGFDGGLEESSTCHIFDDEFTFEDEDSRLIPMA